MRGLPATLALAAILAVAIGPVAAAPLMIVGNDEKLLWDDNGKPILSRPGKDSVLIVDLANPLEPKIVANLPLKNSVVGPPVNLAIDPTGSLALVADSVNVISENGTLKQVPDDKIHVIDLKSNPVKLVQTMTAAKQPSGFASADLIPLLADKTARGAVTTYICENFACQAPLVGVEALREKIG